uniref:LolA-like domain-containing protein n=1 Tax=Strigamia maritima TaxID=126957 RepID=T1IJN4_STRMM
MIDSNTGVCKPLPLQEIDQGSTTSLLLFDNDDIASFKYIGNRSCWQGNCEVWSGVKDGFMYNLYLKHLKQNIDGGLLDSQYIPIQLNINWNGISQEESSMFREYYYNFEAGFPAWEKFDVSNCYKETHKLRFQITFQGSFFGIASIPDFERNVRLQIMQLTQIPEMRMHKFRVDNMLNEFVVVTLTILEDPRLAQEFLRMYRPLPGKSIKDASTRYTDITYDVTATECAKNCFLDPAGCIDFEMCKPFPGTKYKSVCHVLEPKLSTFDEKPEFVENIDCDHYRLIGVHTDFKFDYFNATNDTSNLSAGGYGSGSMAALAIPMLLIAAAVGAGAMLPVLLLCISWSAVLCQNPPKLPEIPDEISISFISTIGKGTDTQEVSVGEIYYSKTLNKGAVVIKRKDDVEHLVFNYNTNELLVISEKDDNLCEFLDIPLLVDGNYNPEVLVSMLTNGSLKFVANETTFGDIPGNLWQGNTEGFGNTIKVTYNELNWTFSSPYTTNMNRPLSLIGINKENAVVSYYFLSTTNSVPHEAFMPPRGAFCRPFADAKQGGPTLPPAFRLDAEIYEGKIGYGSKVFYYEDAKVLREDIISAHQKHQSAIIDRNYGVVYRIDVDTGACAASPLFPKDGESKAGLLVFDNADIASFRYMGNRSCWLGDCEVWTGAKDLYMYNLYLKHSTQNQNDFIPIQLNINHNGTHQEESSMYRQYYYNFEAGYPPWEKFDVTNCYMETLRLRFQITFQGSYLGIASIPDFERSVRLAIMKLTKIPEMRMHEFRVDNMLNEFVVVTLTLLEDPRQARIKVSTSDRDLPSQNSRYSVYFQIEDAIYSDQFKVETQGQDGKPIVFLATDSTYSIMSTKNIDGKGASLVKFKIWGNMRITTTSADTLIEGVTVDACARECDSERHSTCNMFMHCKDSQQCVMSESMYQERSDKHFGSNCDLFQREFAYDYRVYPGARLQIDRTTDSSVTDETLESCFSICRKKLMGPHVIP